MENTKTVIESYERLLKKMDENSIGERWKVERRLANSMLRILTYEKKYHDMRAEQGAKSPITEEQLNDIKRAIDLRKQIYRRRKEMLE